MKAVRYLLDTSICIHAMQGNPAHDKAECSTKRPDEIDKAVRDGDYAKER